MLDLHTVLVAECFLVPAWLLTLCLCIMLVRDYFFPQHASVGEEVARIHGFVFILAQPGLRSYRVAFVSLSSVFSILMKLLVLLVGRM